MKEDLQSKLDALLGDDTPLFESDEIDFDAIEAANTPAEEKSENISSKSLDKSEKSSTLNVEAEKSDFDQYLDTLSGTAREMAMHAKETGWDYSKYKSGKGKSAEVWVATEPYIKTLQEYQSEIKELKKLVSTNTKITERGLSQTKKQAEQYLEGARNRLVDAQDAKDLDAMQTAFNEIESVKQIIADADEQLAEVTETKAPTVSPERLAALEEHSQNYIAENWEWIHPDSPEYNEDKSRLAGAIENQILLTDPNIDPRILYKRINLELKKHQVPTQTQTQDTSKSSPGTRKTAHIEATTRTSNADRRSSSAPSETQKTVMQALAMLNKSQPGRFMSTEEFQKQFIGKK